MLRRAIPKITASAPLVLLAASTLLTAVLAWQAFASSRSHRALAERVLRDYAELAAIEFSRRTTAYIGNYGIVVAVRALTEAASRDPRGLPTHEDIATALPPQSRRAIELIGPVFRFEAAGGAFVSAPGLPATVHQAIAAAVAADVETSFRAVHPILEGETRLYVVAPAGQGRDSGRWLGFEVNIPAVIQWLADYGVREPLLPPALVPPDAARSSLAVTVRAPDGKVLFASPGRETMLAPTAVRDLAGAPAITALEDFTVEIALDPAAASHLVIGGLPRSQTGFLLLILALSAALACAAAVQTRRERRHAELRQDFVTRASHELRTPVARIRMFTETLLLDRLRSDEERRQTLEALDRGARRLSMLIDNVLQLAGRDRRAVVHRERIDVGAFAADVVREFEASIGADSAVSLSAPAGLEACVDAEALRQVLMNLLDNAWKYGGSPPAIDVRLRMHGRAAERLSSRADDREYRELMLEVEDNGGGVPAGDRARIWEPYIRLERHRRSAIAGTGIGLAVVRDLVARQGGTCRVEEGVRGARFVIVLPASQWTDA